MDTGLGVAARIHARARINFILVTALLGVALLAVVGGLLLTRADRTPVPLRTEVPRQQPASGVASPQTMPSADGNAVDVNQLLIRAGNATRQQQYLSPSGTNAFELYLRVLKMQPGNRVATDALRETFSLAADSAEQTINANRFIDAQRQIDLLAMADPGNFIVTILRSKLSAQRKALDQQQEQLATSQQQAIETQANGQLTGELAQQRARQVPAQPKVTLPPPTVVLRAPEPVAAPRPEVPVSTEAVLLQGALPAYPPAALNEKRSGWVMVAFVVDVDGRTSGVQVVDSQPRRVFDRAATDAVRRYRFRPATLNGTPVASSRQQRIEFAQ